jgi:hypothetical protein
LLLQVSLGKVLKLSLWERNISWGRNGKLSAVTTDYNSAGSKSSGLSTNLDAVLEVLLERSYVKYLIVNWSSAVKYEFYSVLCLYLQQYRMIG